LRSRATGFCLWAIIVPAFEGIEDPDAPVMKVFMPTVRPPVVTSDARLPHVPYVPVPQLSVASSAFSGLIARTFSAPLVVSNVSSGLPSSAVIDNPRVGFRV